MSVCSLSVTVRSAKLFGRLVVLASVMDVCCSRVTVEVAACTAVCCALGCLGSQMTSCSRAALSARLVWVPAGTYTRGGSHQILFICKRG